MLKPFSTFLVASLMSGMTAVAVATLPEGAPLANVDEKIPMLDLLPVGSPLNKVSVPRYEGTRLAMLLTADRMTVASPQELVGHVLNIFMYGKDDRTIHITARDVSYFPKKRFVISREETTVKEERFSAKGTGLYMDAKAKRGILLGPGQATIISEESSKL